MAETPSLAGHGMEVQYRPHDPDSPVIVTQDTDIGRGLLVKGSRRRDRLVVISFMGQEIVLDEDYQRFFPDAVAAAIRKLNEVTK